jgi:hypothetical protein
MLYFCTLFDSNYLSKGIAMYESLSKHCREFQLYIFAFDNNCYSILNKLKLPNVTVVLQSEFEDEYLLNVKFTRSRAEYCWTCSSSTIYYCINNFKLDHCTYIDADLFFYSDPAVLIEEMGNKDVLITEHDFSEEYIGLEKNGKYCVQFMTFKNTENGLTVLKWWRNECIKWCYERLEDNKFGDQKYLDDWTVRFSGIHVLQNNGGGIAPWNIQQYIVKYKDSKPFYSKHKKTHQTVWPVFFHFHNLVFYKNKSIKFTSNDFFLSAKVKRFIYYPYINYLNIIKERLLKIEKNIDPHGAKDIDYNVILLRDKLYLYRKAFMKLNFKQIKDVWTKIKKNKNDNINIICGTPN